MSGWQGPSAVRRIAGAKHASKTLAQFWDPAGWFVAKDGYDESLVVRAPVRFGPDGRATVRMEFVEASKPR